MGSGGRLIVRMRIDGSSGRVTSTTVTGDAAGTPLARCVERLVRQARFPPLSRTLTISYPFNFRPIAP